LILGGAQEVAILTVENLQKQYQVTLVSGPALGPEGDLIKRVKESNVNLVIIPQMRRNINPVLDIIAFIKLYFLLRRLRPDVVHTHSAKAGILGRFAAYFAGVKTIVHTIHGLSFHQYQNRLVNFLYVSIERVTALVTTKFISVADAMTRESLRVKIGKPGMYTTIYCSIGMERFESDADAPREIRCQLGLENSKVIGTIARIAPLKGHNYIIQIANRIIREVPDVRFLFVGDGSLYDKVKREIQGRGLEKYFVFTGLVSPERIPSIIKAIDILVHPSLREGLPLVIPQTFALSKPVVSFDIAGSSEVVINSRTGFLIPAPTGNNNKLSRDKLTSAIIYLLKNPDRAREMGENGKKLIIPNFITNFMVEKVVKLYNGSRFSGIQTAN
jgi:glycosyltransferase involved in cell wall biosynthesis